jgi:hypothetical protein
MEKILQGADIRCVKNPCGFDEIYETGFQLLAGDGQSADPPDQLALAKVGKSGFSQKAGELGQDSTPGLWQSAGVERRLSGETV